MTAMRSTRGDVWSFNLNTLVLFILLATQHTVAAGLGNVEVRYPRKARKLLASPPPVQSQISLIDSKTLLQTKVLNATNGRIFNGMSVPFYPASRPSDSVVLSYRVNLPSGFKTGGGGTLPGLMAGGDECPDYAAGVTCWSVQLAWQPDGKGKVIAHIPRLNKVQSPVLFLPRTSLGDGQGVAIRGSDFKWKLDSWNSVNMRVQLNTPGLQNGVVRVEVNGQEIVRVFGLVFRLTTDLGVDAALMELMYTGAIPRSPGGIAQYTLISSIQLYNVAKMQVSGIYHATTEQQIRATSIPFGAGQ